MRTVVTNNEVPHLWAHKAQEHARNSTGSFYFNGDWIYSYRDSFPLARHAVNRGPCVLFRDCSYSVTTGQHQSKVRRAIPPDVPVFTVPDIGQNGEIDHDANLASYRDRIEEHAKRAMRARKHAEWHQEQASEAVDEGNAYLAFFSVKRTRFRVPDSDSLKRKIREQRVQAKKAQQEKEERERKELDRLKKEVIPAWRRGERAGLPYIPGVRHAFLRVIPPTGSSDELEVETSQGARVPVSHVVRVLPFVHAIAEGKEGPFERNGRTIHLGHYSLDRIDQDGTVHAGCHVIPYDEVLYVSGRLTALGVL